MGKRIIPVLAVLTLAVLACRIEIQPQSAQALAVHLVTPSKLPTLQTLTPSPAQAQIARLLTVQEQSVHLRPAPSLHVQYIQTLRGGETVSWLGGPCVSDDLGVVWVPVMYQGRAAWISQDWVEPKVCK